MPEWLKSLLSAVGGGTVVLVGLLTIFKGIFIKLFEAGIESSFEKSVEKFKNKLDRSTRAYQILLDREMRFYEKLEPSISELVPLIQDLLYCLEYQEGRDREKDCDSFSLYLTRYCELILALKNEVLVHHSYITTEIFSAYTSLVKQMQDDTLLWSDMGKFLFAGEYDKIEYKKGKETVDALLLLIASAESKVRLRLQQLSAEG